MENREQTINTIALELIQGFEGTIDRHHRETGINMSDFLEAYVKAGYSVLQQMTAWDEDMIGFTYELNRLIINKIINDAKNDDLEVREISI
jgi:hypothetical protein